MAPFLIGPPSYRPVRLGQGGPPLDPPQGILYPPFMWRLGEKFGRPLCELNEEVDLLDLFLEADVHCFLADSDTPPPSRG